MPPYLSLNSYSDASRGGRSTGVSRGSTHNSLKFQGLDASYGFETGKAEIKAGIADFGFRMGSASGVFFRATTAMVLIRTLKPTISNLQYPWTHSTICRGRARPFATAAMD